MTVHPLSKPFSARRAARSAALAVALLALAACVEQPRRELGVFSGGGQGAEADSALYDLPDIQACGELIVLTRYGAASFFEFHGECFGSQYMVAAAYAGSIGCALRVDVCRSDAELMRKLRGGEGDLVACNVAVSGSTDSDIAYCGRRVIPAFIDTLAAVQRDPSLRAAAPTAWAVRRSSPALAASLDRWLSANRSRLLAIATPRVSDSRGRTYAPRRTPSSPIRNLARGEISLYDQLFRKYARACAWDWRLLAAQAYQESAFDPQAVSWAGAMGLMQLMPATARQVGVADDDVFEPEASIRGAAALIRQLDSHYAGVADANERINFILAAYNAGPGHIDDARRLADKLGTDSGRWFGHVDQVVARMSESRYFDDPVVRHGYFRGAETCNYVADIRARWDGYRRKVR